MVSQAKKWGKTFEIGSLLQILGRITTLHAILNTPEPEHGGFMVKFSQSGNSLAQVHSCGYMGSVSVCAVIIFPQLTILTFTAGAGKSILWYINLFMFSFRKLISCHHPVRQSSRTSAACANQDSHHLPSFIATSEKTKRGTAVDYFPLSWSSFVNNLMSITTTCPNSMRYTSMAHNMRAILNWPNV